MKFCITLLFTSIFVASSSWAAESPPTSPLVSPLFFGPAALTDYSEHDSVGLGVELQHVNEDNETFYRTQALGLFSAIKNRFNFILVPSGVFGSKHDADQTDISGGAAFAITEHLSYGVYSSRMKFHPNTTNELLYHQEQFEVGVSHNDSSSDSVEPAYLRVHGQWHFPLVSVGVAYDRYLMYTDSYHSISVAASMRLRPTSTLQVKSRITDGKYDLLKVYWSEALSESLFAGFAVEHSLKSNSWINAVSFDVRKDLN